MQMEQTDPPAKVASNDQLGPTLLACPFCGGGAMFTVEQRENHPDFGGHSAMCGTCGAGIGYVFACGDDPLPLLSEQWNKCVTGTETAMERARCLSSERRRMQHQLQAMGDAQCIDAIRGA
jgi:hypothetical protein